MGEDIKSNNTYKSSLTRSIGVGLTRSKLSSGGLIALTQKSGSGASVSLTAPSSVLTSALSPRRAEPRRTDSERYGRTPNSSYGASSSGVSRLGGLRNASAPNISSLVTSGNLKTTLVDKDHTKIEVDSDLNGINSNQLPQRSNTSSVSTTSTGKIETSNAKQKVETDLHNKDITYIDKYHNRRSVPNILNKEYSSELCGENRSDKDFSVSDKKDVSGLQNVGRTSAFSSLSALKSARPSSSIEADLTSSLFNTSTSTSKVTNRPANSSTLDSFGSETTCNSSTGPEITSSTRPGITTKVVKSSDYNLEDYEETALECSVKTVENLKAKPEPLRSGNTDILASPRLDSGYSSPRTPSNIVVRQPVLQEEPGDHSNQQSDINSNQITNKNFNLGSVEEKIDTEIKSKKLASNLKSFVTQDVTRSKEKTNVNVISELDKSKKVTPQSNISLGIKSSIPETGKDTVAMTTVMEGEGQDVPTPIARPRTRRRLTKRAVSFKRVEDDEFIGFASLPEQVHRKAVRRGFEFTLMVVGETGLGKSTLINSLFLTDLYKDRKVGKIEERLQKTVDLEKKELEIEERGVKLKLTIVDTPGFNDAVNAEESWKPIVHYIDKQFDAYFKAESGLNRKNIQDTRVHCCLYFISPYGHGLRPVDVWVMKKLHHKVNIVPLIAKADMLTKIEVKKLKEKVLHEIEKHHIRIYQFPDCDSDEDDDFKQQDSQLKKSIPFAVVGSNTVVEAGGKKIRGRMYPWGIVEVENPSHCDFTKLRQMLISTHMQDLKDVTCDCHYENYRAEHITEQMSSQQKERGKLKRDSMVNLESAIDTDKLLQEKEAEIRRMQEMLVKMQAQLQKNSPQMNGKVGHV